MVLNCKRVDLYWILEKKFCDEALEQIAQESCGYPIPARVQDQVAWGPGQPDLVRDVLTLDRALEEMIFEVLSKPNHSTVLIITSLQFKAFKCIKLQHLIYKFLLSEKVDGF